MAYLYANNASSTLASGLSNAATTINLSPGGGSLFPLPTGGDVFYATLSDTGTNTIYEIVQVTARASDALTVVRGQDGTTALTWNTGDTFSLRAIRLEYADFLSKANGGNISGTTTTVTQTAGDNSTKLSTTAYVDAIKGRIVSLTAPVVSTNTLNIGVAGGQTFDFRSPTLTSQAVNTRFLSSSSTITIPQGATLGAVNAVSADFVVGLMDNVGTPEVFVVNISGGFNLDETTLISTTAISAAATSNTTAYSNVARTNLPFKVCGIYRNTQATAGTYLTTPSLVQGLGGEALTAMSSLGFGQTYQVVTRTSGTTYYNTTGRTITLMITMSVSSLANVLVNGTNPFGSSIGDGGTGQVLTPVTVPVPPGASYSITTTQGTIRATVELR